MYWLAQYLMLPARVLACAYLWLARPLAEHRAALRLYARLLIANGLLLVFLLAATTTAALMAGASGAFSSGSPVAFASFAWHALVLGWAGAGSLMAGYPLLRTRQAREPQA